MSYNVVPLPREQWKGYPLVMDYSTNEYYAVSIKHEGDSFKVTMVKKHVAEPIVHTSEEYDFPDSLYQAHWEKAEAFGVIEDDELVGAVEICPEEWSNRLMVTEMWVKEGHRKQGIGKALMDYAKARAVADDRRAMILETQSCNSNAIGFYLHEGFELIGFDSCCYTNADIERREVRLDLGWFPEAWRGVAKRR